MLVGTISCYHNSAAVASQRRLKQFGKNRVSVGYMDDLPAYGHISKAAGEEE